MKLLIADDDKISGILLVKHAKARGFDPIYVQNGEEAHEILAQKDGPKIALLDWMMPGMTGLEIIQKLRSRSEKNEARHYLIVLTARSEKKDVVTALKAGADDYIIKPFDPEELKARLEVGRRIITLTENLSRALEESRRLTDFIAHFDQTTGLPNHLSLMEEIDRVQNLGIPHALFLVNLDRFKIINQVYGIGNGDMVISLTGARIKQCFNNRAFVARLAADEFAVLLPLKGNSFEEFERQIITGANQLHKTFETPFHIDRDKITLSVSIGVSIISVKLEGGGEEFIRKADFALKKAKKEGGNTTVIHDPKAEKELQQRFRLERELEVGIKRDELVMFIQPQFTKEGKAVAAEVLVRWEHPEKGLLPPGVFIPVAEESDLIIGIGEVMFKKACNLVTMTSDKDFTVSVNISPRQFQDEGFTTFLKSVLEETGADPGRIILEVTEGLLIKDVDSVIKKMKELTEMGLHFSVDDFGTGYSSLMYLKKLPIRELKIDRAFIAELPNDKNDAAIVETIVAIARHLGFKLVAEGVETREQVDFLSSIGDMLFQGYFFARPEPADDILRKFF